MSQAGSLDRRPEETLEQWVDRIRPDYKGDIILEGDHIIMRPWPHTPNLISDSEYERLRQKAARAKTEGDEEEYYSEADW